jgi:hypothetical protein
VTFLAKRSNGTGGWAQFGPRSAVSPQDVGADFQLQVRREGPVRFRLTGPWYWCRPTVKVRHKGWNTLLRQVVALPEVNTNGKIQGRV